MKKSKLITMTLLMSAMLSFNSYAAGWEYDGADWRYEEQNRYVSKDWRFINNRWYYFNEDTTMHTGWLEYKGQKYYLDAVNGDMKTGEQIIDGDLCYFSKSGALINTDITQINGLEEDLLIKAHELYYDNYDNLNIFLEKVNKERAAVGSGPVSLDKTLCINAIYRCLEMEKYNYFAHEYDNTLRFRYIQNHLTLQKAGPISENLSKREMSGGKISDYFTEDKLFNDAIVGFRNSPEHNKAQINPSYTKAGFGLYMNEKESRYYITELFTA